MKKQKIVCSLITNSLIYILMVIGLVLLFTVDGMTNEAFIYFTTDSNILMGLASLIYVVFLVLQLTKTINKMPKAVEIIKLASTVSVTLTFFTVVTFLVWTIDTPAILFMSSQALFHVVIPLLSIATWLIFEHSLNKIKFPESIYGIIPMGIYAIAYIAVALSHIRSGTVPSEYDWYGFCSFGVKYVPLAIILMLGVTFLFSWLLWLGNKKINIWDKKISVRH